MLVMHSVGLIFVRTRKTAGTSTEIALSRHAADQDVITSLSPRDEALRAECGGRPPQNHLHPGREPGAVPVPPGPGDGVRFYNHMPAAEIREEIGDGVWNSYLTVCLERNPFEKVVSLYFHRYRTEPRPPIDEFIRSGEFRDTYNWPLYADADADGSLMVDMVIDHQNLQAGLDEICQRTGIPRLTLPRAKSQFRPPKTPYRDVLTRAARAAVEDSFAAEFNHHGYTW